MSILTFQEQLPIHSSQLPLTLISLENLTLISVSGKDSSIFLQSQITCDITRLNINNHLLAAHCNARGKIWSILRLFQKEHNYYYIIPNDLSGIQLAEFKKYSVFSNVIFKKINDIVMLGIAGFQARMKLGKLFNNLPDNKISIIHENNTTIIWMEYPTERFLLIMKLKEAKILQEKLPNDISLNNSIQWLSLDIEAGIPIINTFTSGMFIPQAVNLQALDAINFNKGCYTGQEIISRAKYCGFNKRALYWLSGMAYRLPNINSALEFKIGNNWRCTGNVLASIKLADDTCWVQVVMNNNININSNIRVKGDDNSKLLVQPLPYSLDNF